ncbi:septal ring lytic transglycosylase RlpA family protein [Sphingopyxis sp. YF1]|jgi:rare lipoprotein A|uniref:septal ring lytic transglycosylase RlpA family protein n=1 Tax=Sphingopyxis sp. YF1 TaxID=2482763 RepID=UPI001F61198C|nr:septal ring lytic transglycosylase RlpA family protein [Sphingopyxis sp. YF1]UNU44589.1 septal ring lytic transglycosylase RlpA family protein [Sphingopyxis sp. YF1]HZG31659.1 septal ring lytic transglycosylase RlpA family protein [Sphingopyxis sp.]
MRALFTMVMPLLLVASAAAQDAEIDEQPAASAEVETVIDGGMASYYGRELEGNRTASGERFDPDELTAAHRTLPFGSKVRVTNVSNGDSVIVRINDRGPFSHGRVIDVSHAAAREIGMHRSGTARVKLALLVND